MGDSFQKLRNVIAQFEGDAFYPAVAITERWGSTWLVCANGHLWGSVEPEAGCPTCKENHRFRLKGRTECEEEGCDNLVTCSDRLWEEGNRKCQMHWTRAGGYTVGPVSCDETIAILAQYNPRHRWNGWLAAPYFDAWSVQTFLESLANVEEFYKWEWGEEGELILTDINYVDEEGYTPEVNHPDEDGLYTFGGGWVWYEDTDNYGTTEEWVAWSKEHSSVFVQASNANNHRLIEQGVQDRFAANEEVGRQAAATWLEDHPEPEKYPHGAPSWVDLTGKVVMEDA